MAEPARSHMRRIKLLIQHMQNSIAQSICSGYGISSQLAGRFSEFEIQVHSWHLTWDCVNARGGRP
jgi:hypothetical protein